jgi:tRNA G46 methylase TrmB
MFNLNKGERNMKKYTIKFRINNSKDKSKLSDTTLAPNGYFYKFTDSENLLEDYLQKYWDREINNLIIINEETDVEFNYDNTPALARKERA